MNAHLARIAIYPIKSFDAAIVSEATLLPKGALAFDRRYALKDLDGEFMNGKRSPKLQQIRARFEPDFSAVTLVAPGMEETTFRLPSQGGSLAGWCGRFLGQPLVLGENSIIGFPDDLDFTGPTLISTATLEAVAGWFGLSLDDVRGRFRVNLEVGGVPAFWEDRLVPREVGQGIPVRIGAEQLIAVNACMRCVVPTRDPLTGAHFKGFVAKFSREREAALPEWAAKERFDSYYRLSVNMKAWPDTLAAGSSCDASGVGEPMLKVDDPVEFGDAIAME